MKKPTIGKEGLKRNMGTKVRIIYISDEEKRIDYTGILRMDDEGFYVGNRRHRVKEGRRIAKQNRSGDREIRYYDVTGLD